MSSNQKRWFYISLLISLLIHVSTFVSLRFLPRSGPPPVKEIEVTILDSSDDSKNLPMPQQIVDQPEQAINDEKPKDTKYLSRHDQRVEKETRAEANGAFANRDNGTPQPQQNAQSKQAKSSNAENKTEDNLEPGPGKRPKIKDLIPKYSWNSDSAAAKQGQGVSTTDDFLKDKAKGAETLLNTREFVYFSYYSRIKERLRMYWEPKIKGKITRLLNQGRKLASDQDHITKVIITLDAKGTLVKVQVVSESGVRDLDDAAIEAFQAAAPFPNPPAGIIDSDGTIKIRWDFVLEANNVNTFIRDFANAEKSKARPTYMR